MKINEAYYGYRQEVAADDATIRVRCAIPLREQEQMA